MEQKRKIQAVVSKVSFTEAEDADDLYWSKKTELERLEALFMLRAISFGQPKLNENLKMKKVAVKKYINEQE